MRRKIALDVGDKTIGVALSDELGITGQGTYDNRKNRNKERYRKSC